MTWEADRCASEHPGQVGKAMSVCRYFPSHRTPANTSHPCHGMGIEARRSLAWEQLELGNLGTTIKKPLPLHRLLPETAKHPANSLSRFPGRAPFIGPRSQRNRERHGEARGSAAAKRNGAPIPSPRT